MDKKVTVVVPVYFNEGSLVKLFKELLKLFNTLLLNLLANFELKKMEGTAYHPISNPAKTLPGMIARCIDRN